jgi:hypothetical protein
MSLLANWSTHEYSMSRFFFSAGCRCVNIFGNERSISIEAADYFAIFQFARAALLIVF